MNSLEIQVLKNLDEIQLKDQTLLLGISGGLDSVALSEVMATLAPRRNLKLVFAHIHHGQSASMYRDRAEALVQKIANDKGSQFLISKYFGPELKSEAALRDYRLKSLEELRIQSGAQYIVLAHHANDLLETRLIRLLRGVGPQGLESMSLLSGVILHPFLELTREDLHNYALSRGLEWLEDPTNMSQEPLRNWIRSVWLPMVEQKRTGSTKSLMNSLNLLTQNSDESISAEITEGVDRFELAKLSFREQRRVLAQYVFKSGLKDYSVTHLDEILKRLDSPQKDFTFSLLKREWRVDTKRIRVESKS